MAHFRGELYGQRGDGASRLGSKASGIEGRVYGWRRGVRVMGRFDAKRGDVFEVYATGGANGAEPERHVATIDSGACDVSDLVE